MNSQPSTSYSTSHTLWGLSRRYLAILLRDLTTGPIINSVGLRNFWTKSETYAWQRGGAKMRYFWCTFHFWGPFFKWTFFPWWDLEIFHDIMCVCVKPYDQPCWNLNNSTIWRSTSSFFQNSYIATLFMRNLHETSNMMHSFRVGSP